MCLGRRAKSRQPTGSDTGIEVASKADIKTITHRLASDRTNPLDSLNPSFPLSIPSCIPRSPRCEKEFSASCRLSVDVSAVEGGNEGDGMGS